MRTKTCISTPSPPLLWIPATVRVLFLICPLVACAPVQHEPTYQKRTLSQWLQLHQDAFTPGAPASLRRDQSLADSEAAIRAIGTNALPSLERWVQAKRSPVRDRAILLLNPWADIYDAKTQHNMAWWGFHILGKSAQPAVPTLIRMTRDKDPENRLRAVKCLEQIGPKKEIFMPELARLLHDSNNTVRFWAAAYLAEVYPSEAEKLRVYEEFHDLSTLRSNPTHDRKGGPSPP